MTNGKLNKEWEKYYYSKKINLGNPIKEEHKERFRELLDLKIKILHRNDLPVPTFDNFWVPYYFDIEAVEKDYPCLVEVCQKINELKAEVAGDKTFLLKEKLNKHLTINISLEKDKFGGNYIEFILIFKNKFLTEEHFNVMEITNFKERWINVFIEALKEEKDWAKKVYNRLQEIEDKEECELYKELLDKWEKLILTKCPCKSCPKKVRK